MNAPRKLVANAEQRNTWEAAAPGWAKWEQQFSAGLVDATDTLLDMADVGPGMRVLDLACGAGSQTLRAASRVGPTGFVVATDISANMLEYVREHARRGAFDNIRTVESAAEELDPAQGPYDAAISRLGLMLFSSPSRALAAVQKVLKPKARFAALVFTAPANNPFASLPMQILLRHAGKQPPAPGQPGIFALGGNGVLERLFRDNGLIDVRTRVVRASLRLANASVALQMMQEAFGAYRAVVSDLSEAARANAWAEVADCIRQFETGSGFEAQAEFLVGSGAKPG
jgi:ubiquinone/menaquinone biosynthesis C-methylase UbiE